MKRRIASRGSIAAATMALMLLGNGIAFSEEPNKGRTTARLTVTSSAFQQGESIPAKYTCDGADISPPLAWTGSPAGARSFALICDDPDAPAGTWVHWVLFNLRASATELGEKVKPVAALPDGGSQGKNSFAKIGYGGPCPPAGKAHRYFFKVYALDADLALKPGATKEEVLRAMENHVLAQGEIVGTYQRKR